MLDMLNKKNKATSAFLLTSVFRPQLRKLLSFSLVLLTMTGCEKNNSRVDAEVYNNKQLKVLTLNSPTTYYFDRENLPAGPDYELIEAFAKNQQFNLEISVQESVSELLTALQSGEYDLAIANLTATASRADKFQFSSPYQKVTQQLVCRRGGKVANNSAELNNVSLGVVSKSSYEETLTDLKTTIPDLQWQSIDNLGSEDLLEMVWKKEIDCTIADSNIVAINQRYYPELKVMFDLTQGDQIVVFLRPNASQLLVDLNQWLVAYKEEHALSNLMEKYYGFVKIFDYVDTKKLINRIDTSYTPYAPLFSNAARLAELDTHLLSAQSYQESHWNPEAKSPTGVRGMMMLTRATAKQMKIKNRLDAEQSITAGAQYLSSLKNRFDSAVTEPDRTWLALASYNIGRGHIHDAQTLARSMGKSPYLWRDIKEVLPLLGRKQYYTKLKYGYARGNEPVRYVQRIRDYKHVLEKHLNLAALNTTGDTIDVTQ